MMSQITTHADQAERLAESAQAVMVDLHRPRHFAARIEFCGFAPTMMKLARSLVIPELRLLPRWCATLNVIFSESVGDADAAASCWASPDYAAASIRLHPTFFGSDYCDAERRRMLRHGLMHLAVSPMFDWARVELREATGSKIAENEIVSRCERVVVSLTEIVDAITEESR